MINLSFFSLSAFDKKILKECPAMQYGASFIKYISWFQVVASFFSGWLALSIFNIFNTILNLLLAVSFSFVHLATVKLFDDWLHKYRKWSTFLSVTFLILIIAFLQTIYIGNYLFKTEFQIQSILSKQRLPEYWLEKPWYYVQKPLYIFSFKDIIVSIMSIAIFIVTSFIGILPFALTFYYSNSKYYETQKLIENFKLENERITTK